MLDHSSFVETEQFNIGEVWRSPNGTIYTVENIGLEQSKRELLFAKKKTSNIAKGYGWKRPSSES